QPPGLVGPSRASLHGAAVAAGHDAGAGAPELPAEIQGQPVDGIRLLHRAAPEHSDERALHDSSGGSGPCAELGRGHGENSAAAPNANVPHFAMNGSRDTTPAYNQAGGASMAPGRKDSVALGSWLERGAISGPIPVSPQPGPPRCPAAR